MLEVKFYNNRSANNIVHKNITLLDTQNCNVWEDCEIQSPTLLVDNNNIIGANYCYIPAFSRYYYISNVSIYNGNKLRVSLRCDVLMSFYNSFSSSTCIAKRSSSNINPYIVDNAIVYKPTKKLVYRKMGTGFTPSASAGCYVLTLGGAR